MEKEIKLVSTPEGRKKLFELPFVRDKILPGTEKTLDLWNEYYDTADMALTQNGIAYRIRRINGRAYEATVKTRGVTENGFSSREEYTVPLAEPVPMRTGFSPEMDSILSQLLADKKLVPFCTVAFTRHLALLDLGGGSRGELALDGGSITAGGKTQPLAEVELESKEGREENLFIFVDALKKIIPLQPENRSKLARGLALLEKKSK